MRKGVVGTTVSEEISRLSRPVHLLQHIRQDPKEFPCQPKDIVPSVCPGSLPEPSPSGTYLEHFRSMASRRNLRKTPETLSLTHFNDEEQRLYAELLSVDQAPHSVPKGASSHQMQETHFGHLYSQCHFFGNYLKLKTIGEGGNVDRPVN